jgi:hypothetical protein
MRTNHLAGAVVLALSCALLTASCLQGATATSKASEPGSDTEPSGLKDDGDPFGSDPDVGPSIGGSEPPSAVWGPVSPEPSPGPVADPDPDPDPDTSGDLGLDPPWGHTPGSPARPVGSRGSPARPPGREPPKPCDEKCETDYETAAAACGRIEDAGRRGECQDRAHARYRRCGEDCQRTHGECEDRCDEEAEACERECRKIPEGDKNRRQRCWVACNEANGRCRKKCRDGSDPHARVHAARGH